MTDGQNSVNFWLGGDRLPSDLVRHLSIAHNGNDPRVPEVVGLIEDLLSLVTTNAHANGLTRAEARAAIRSAIDFVVERWILERIRDGTLTDADVASADVSMIPTREFMRRFVRALARQVHWKRNDIETSGAAPSDLGKA